MEGKIEKLLSQNENRRFDYFKDEAGNVHRVDRMPTSQGHFRVLHKKDGKKEAGYISADEYKKIKDSFEQTGNLQAYEALFKKNKEDTDESDSGDQE